MPAEVLDRPNPQPLPSLIPEDVLSLAIKLEKAKLDETTYNGLQQFRRAADYIAAGMSTGTLFAGTMLTEQHQL